ncbi:MAG: hypothetical protein WDN08_21130 [Rhizomicrobium sp.]
MPQSFTDPDALADAIIAAVGRRIVLGLPLGLGKANHVANALFRRALRDPSIDLTIFTALTLEAPAPRSELERRFIAPDLGAAARRLSAARLRRRPAQGHAAAQHPGRRVLLPRRPLAGAIRRRSAATSRRITPMPPATCWRAASTSSPSLWRGAATAAAFPAIPT